MMNFEAAATDKSKQTARVRQADPLSGEVVGWLGEVAKKRLATAAASLCGSPSSTLVCEAKRVEFPDSRREFRQKRRKTRSLEDQTQSDHVVGFQCCLSMPRMQQKCE